MKKKITRKLSLKKKTVMHFTLANAALVVGGRTAASDCLGDCDYDTVPGVSCYIPC